jgi:hypothetical protein
VLVWRNALAAEGIEGCFGRDAIPKRCQGHRPGLARLPMTVIGAADQDFSGAEPGSKWT